MGTEQGADERRIQRIMRTRGVGPDATLPDPPPPADDWWDRLYDDTTKPGGRKKGANKAKTKREPEPDAEWEDAEPDDETTPATRRRTAHSPARRLQAAYVELAPRTRVLLYNGTAAGGGWCLGLVQPLSDWITTCGHDRGTGAALALGSGMVLAAGVLIDRRTRHWWGPLPWLCRIPLASALLALALYAPGVTP